MAINIFSGQSGKSSVNKASQSSRAQAAKANLGTAAAETSASGNTAVKTSGALSKVGNVIGNVAGIASKFLPGVAGTVASGLANIFNDPEWWQSVPGEQITMNVPQRIVSVGESTTSLDLAGNEPVTRPIYSVRPAITEFCSVDVSTTTEEVFTPSETMITQYLMPEIRKVVNAVPLQSAAAYREVLTSHVAIYALWRQLKKYDFILKHGTTYIPNLNNNTFPMFKIENAAYLQSTINRVEEYLRANVRVPHTLCEYLAWRFGRVYRTCDSGKAGFVLHNVLSVHAEPASWSALLNRLMAVPTSTTENQKANADLFNTYYDHDMMVEIRDDTQMVFDAKEFALRTNLDITLRSENVDSIPIYIDSKLDNPTVFMASTVSTYGGEPTSPLTTLFPVRALSWFIYNSEVSMYLENGGNPADYPQLFTVGNSSDAASAWQYVTYRAAAYRFDPARAEYAKELAQFIRFFTLLKATDTYNKNLSICVYGNKANTNTPQASLLDVSSLNMDMGTVSGIVLSNEHVFAFANLVNISRKRSQTIAQADKKAASEVANLVDKMDIATAGTSIK